MRSQRPWAYMALAVVAVGGIGTGRPKTKASRNAGHSRAQAALRRSVPLEEIRCVCLEERVIGRLQRWVATARGRK